MQHQEFESPEELQDNIKCFWYDRFDLNTLQSSFEVVPDGYAEIIFYFGNTLCISLNDVLQPLPSPFLIGLLNQPVVFHTTNHLEIIGIRCFPWMVFDLLELPSDKDGIRTFEHPVASLQPALQKHISAGLIEEAIAQIKQYFLEEHARIISGKHTKNMLSKAGLAMRKANGIIPVSQIAAAAHATVRTLERKFKQSSGYSVKDVAGLMRFEQARNQLWLDPDTNLASLAHELGYADQSHLSREFKRYSGTTPAAFARKAKKEKKIVAGYFNIPPKV